MSSLAIHYSCKAFFQTAVGINDDWRLQMAVALESWISKCFLLVMEKRAEKLGFDDVAGSVVGDSASGLTNAGYASDGMSVAGGGITDGNRGANTKATNQSVDAPQRNSSTPSPVRPATSNRSPTRQGTARPGTGRSKLLAPPPTATGQR